MQEESTEILGVSPAPPGWVVVTEQNGKLDYRPVIHWVSTRVTVEGTTFPMVHPMIHDGADIVGILQYEGLLYLPKLYEQGMEENEKASLEGKAHLEQALQQAGALEGKAHLEQALQQAGARKKGLRLVPSRRSIQHDEEDRGGGRGSEPPDG